MPSAHLTVHIFEKNRNVVHLTDPMEWLSFECITRTNGAFRVYVSTYYTSIRQFALPTASAQQMQFGCQTLLAQEFVAVKKYSSFLYRGLFGKIRAIGFDETALILIRNHDKTYSLFRLARDSGACLFAKSTPRETHSVQDSSA